MLSETPIVIAKRKSRQYSQTEKKAFIAKWKQSNLTRSEFCRREGLCLQTFCYWLKTSSTKVTPKPTSAVSFIALENQNNTTLSTHACIEIHLPNGLRCYFKNITDIQLLVKTVEGLSHVTHD